MEGEHGLVRSCTLRAMEIGPLRERVSKLQSRLTVLRGHL